MQGGEQCLCYDKSQHWEKRSRNCLFRTSGGQGGWMGQYNVETGVLIKFSVSLNFYYLMFT